MSRRHLLELVGRNIREHGFHQYLVQAGTVPRLAYTVGLQPSLGAELVLAGAIVYLADEVRTLINVLGRELAAGRPVDGPHTVEGLGTFTLRKADRTWTRPLLLGALDYHQVADIDAYQIVPDEDHLTIDVPDMSVARSGVDEPVWQWIDEPWTLPVPATATAATDLEAMRGYAITEVARWGDDEWEMFAGDGPEVPPADMRVVSVGTLVAFDPSLGAALNLPIGKALWRDGEGGDWQPWEAKG